VTDVVINFCTDTTCTPVTTAEMGRVIFTGHPAKYHAQIARAPEGWQLIDAGDWYTEPYSQTFRIPFSAVESESEGR